MNVIQRVMRRPFFIRLFHWEYWSFGAVYGPIYPIWVWLSIRSRSFFFFSAANPKIRNGGFLGESKKDIHTIMQKELFPRTLHFERGSDAEAVLQMLSENAFRYPMIGKPDNGGRGRGVRLLKNEGELVEYARSAVVDYHIQEFVEYEHEVGIFYYRMPGERKGHISGIVRKEFLAVTGDGAHTIEELLMKEERSLLQLKNLKQTYGRYLATVLPDGEKKLLVPYGNHARGAKFLDDSHLADEQLLTVINDICSKIDEFYFGRLDIKYKSWSELKQGKYFSVIEVNGAGSEPTHMYDPRHSLFFAWKEIVRHWFILQKISRINHQRGYKYLTVKEGLQMFREDKEHSRKLLLMR